MSVISKRLLKFLISLLLLAIACIYMAIVRPDLKVTDFRNVRWEMTKEQVIKSELELGNFTYEEKTLADDKSDRLIYHDLTVNGEEAELYYKFTNNHLVEGAYHFIYEDKNDNFMELEEVISLLNRKYGKPISKDDLNSINMEKDTKAFLWSTRRDIITLLCVIENGKYYYSIFYDSKESEKKNLNIDAL